MTIFAHLRMVDSQGMPTSAEEDAAMASESERLNAQQMQRAWNLRALQSFGKLGNGAQSKARGNVTPSN